MTGKGRDRISIESDFLLAFNHIESIADILFFVSSDLNFSLDQLQKGSLNSLVNCCAQEAKTVRKAYEELENLCLSQEGKIKELEAQSC
jgi:hypothetical protein